MEKNGVKKDITTEIKDVLKQLKKEAGTNEHIMEEMPWTEDDECLWKDNVKVGFSTKLSYFNCILNISILVLKTLSEKEENAACQHFVVFFPQCFLSDQRAKAHLCL